MDLLDSIGLRLANSSIFQILSLTSQATEQRMHVSDVICLHCLIMSKGISHALDQRWIRGHLSHIGNSMFGWQMGTRDSNTP